MKTLQEKEQEQKEDKLTSCFSSELMKYFYLGREFELGDGRKFNVHANIDQINIDPLRNIYEIFFNGSAIFTGEFVIFIPRSDRNGGKYMTIRFTAEDVKVSLGESGDYKIEISKIQLREFDRSKNFY